jgi:hypothetical protein
MAFQWCASAGRPAGFGGLRIAEHSVSQRTESMGQERESSENYMGVEHCL